VDARRADVLFIEASRMAGTGSLTLTGQLGEVMKESARAALSWFRAHARRTAPTRLLQERRDPSARAVGRDSQGRPSAASRSPRRWRRS
jgi:hypothetical protein